MDPFIQITILSLAIFIFGIALIIGIILFIVWIIKKSSENKPPQINNYYYGQPPYQKVDQQTLNQQQPKI